MCVKNYKLFAEQHCLTNQVTVSIRFVTRLSKNRVSDCLTSAFVLLSWIEQTVRTLFDKNSNFKMKKKKGNKICRKYRFIFSSPSPNTKFTHCGLVICIKLNIVLGVERGS